MTIPETTLRRGKGFVPTASMRAYAGFPVWPAEHKMTPADFTVRERQPGLQCSEAPESDFESREALDNSAGRFVAVTLVKQRKTTPDAVGGVAKLLKIPNGDISAAGLKDRTAITSQMIVIRTNNLEHVRAHCFPKQENLRRYGFFIKDARRYDKMLGKGHLNGNQFQINLRLAGRSKADLEAYLEPRVAYLTRHHQGKHVLRVPNFFGSQRCGQRQNNIYIGWEFITKGLEAGCKAFVCDVVEENDHPRATDLRRKLRAIWEQAENKAAEKGEPLGRQLYCWMDMKELLDKANDGRPAYLAANMFIERKLIKALMVHLDFEKAVKSLRDDLSLSIGAWQAYWFNQVLADVNDESKEISISNLEVDRLGEPVIPLFFSGDKQSVAFYERWCPQAIPPAIDEKVKEIFLSNADGRRGPRRPAYIFVNELNYQVQDEAVTFSFYLRSGAFATTFLSYLFNLDGDKDESGLSLTTDQT